jgi:long-subunit fatty acid transport protein
MLKPKMFKKTLLVAGIGLALSATAQADYNWEVGAGVALGNIDTEIKNTANFNEKNSEDSTIGFIDGSYFFHTVDTSKGPLKEAAFLDHASRLTLGFGTGEIDLRDGGDEDGESYLVDMRYVAEGPGWSLSGLIVDVGWERREPGDQRIDRYGLGLGYYLGENTTAVLDYRKTNINNGGDADSWGLNLEHFFAMNNGGIKVRGSGGKTVISGLDDPTTWNIGATWYINNNWGFGADFGKTDISGFETDAASVDVSWFITENFEIDLAYKTVQPDDFDFNKLSGGEIDQGKLNVEYDEVALSARYRF